MAYRGEDAGDILEAPTAGGAVSVNLGPNRLSIAIGSLSLHLAERTATVTELVGKRKRLRRTSYALTGIIYARGYPRDDIGLWIEAKQDLEKQQPRANLRRIFGIEPVSLLEPTGLRALAKLETVASRLRTAVDDYAGAANLWFARGTEIGAGHPLDKVLFADYGDHHAIYARKLFRDRARLLATVHPKDSRVVVFDAKATHEVSLTSRFGVTIRGDYIRFADKHGTDLARISVPWVSSEDREELARRIGQLVHRSR
jgi:hypothetical protein